MNVGLSIGVAVGAGWQSVAAYVNIGSYYLIGIPIGVLLGNLLHLQVKVINFTFTWKKIISDIYFLLHYIIII